MLLSIITPVFNRSQFLFKIAESIRQQKNVDFSDFEWIVVDDGSTDDIGQVMQSLLLDCDFNIKFISKNNGGKHSAINVGLNHVSSLYTVILDSDDVLVTDTLQYILRCIKENSCEIMAFLHSLSKPKKNTLDYYTLTQFLQLNTEAVFCVNSEVFKNNNFPEFFEERFLTESVVWNKLINMYGLTVFNKVVVEGEYLSDGLSNRYSELVRANPIGCIELIKVNSKINFFDKNLIKQSLYHYSFLISYKNNMKLMSEIGIAKAMVIIAGSLLVRCKRSLRFG